MAKKRKADFQKVKLKVGRRLKSRDNITQTKFKSKKIILPDQLKHNVVNTEGREKLEFCDLLKRLDHCNASFRQQSLSKIKELMMSNQDRILPEHTNVLSKTCRLLLDQDANVRKEVLHVIKVLFEIFSSEQLSLLSPMMKSYLLCGMTHIDLPVRLDSLKYFDLVLEYTSNSLSSSGSVLNMLLGLISSSKQTKRSLTISPNDRITAQEWRMHVFSRLLKLLNVCIDNMKPEENSYDPCIENLYWDRKNFVCAVKRHYDSRPPNMLTFSLNRSGFSNSNDCSSSDPEFVEQFVQELMPLLFDTWKEALPELNDTMSNSFTTESIEVMSVIMQLLFSIVEWLTLIGINQNNKMLEDFKRSYSEEIQMNLFIHFPFSFKDFNEGRSIKKNKKKIHEIKSVYLHLNFAICQIFSCMIVETQNMDIMGTILDYLLIQIKRKCFVNAGISDLTNILKRFLLNDITASKCEGHLCSMFELYQQLNRDCEDYKHLLQFFIDLSLDLKFRHLAESTALSMWLNDVPKNFTEMQEGNPNKHLLVAIMKISCRNYPTFMQGLQDEAELVMEKLCSKDRGIQEVSAHLITKLPSITLELFSKLSAVVCSPSLPAKVTESIIQTLYERVHGTVPAFSPESFISLLLSSIVCAMSGENFWREDEVEVFRPIVQVIPFDLSSFIIKPSKDWEWHKDLVNTLLSALARMKHRASLSLCVQHFLLQFLSNVKQVPVHIAAAVLELYSKFVLDEHFSQNCKELIPMMAEFTLAFCLYEAAVATLFRNEKEFTAYSLAHVLYGNIKNFIAIISVMQLNIRAIQGLESARYMGEIIVKLMTAVPMTTDDYVFLSTFLHDLKSMLGTSVELEQWWKDTFSGLS